MKTWFEKVTRIEASVLTSIIMPAAPSAVSSISPSAVTAPATPTALDFTTVSSATMASARVQFVQRRPAPPMMALMRSNWLLTTFRQLEKANV